MVSITLEGLWMVSDRIVNFNFSLNFTGPDLLKFSVLELSQAFCYGSKKLLIKPRFIMTSSRWSVLLWND